MDAKTAVRLLGNPVHYVDKLHGIDSNGYILSGIIIRKDNEKLWYQAELKELRANSVTIARLEDIEETTVRSALQEK